MAINVGSVSVRVVPDTENFARDLHAKLADLGNVSVKVDLDTGAARAKLDELGLALDRLGSRSPNVGVDVHTLSAEGHIAALEASIFGLEGELASLVAELEVVGAAGSGAMGGIGAATDAATGSLLPFSVTLHGLAITFLVIFAPAIVAAAAALTLVAAGLAAVTLAATAGVGVFALAIIPQLQGAIKNYGSLQAAQAKVANAPTVKAHTAALLALKNLTKSLPPGQFELLNAISGVSNVFQKFAGSVLKTGAPVLTAFVKTLGAFLTGITPLASAAAPALTSLANGLTAAFASPAFKSFIDGLGKLAGPSITGLGKLFGEMASGLGSLILAFGPTGLQVLHGLTSFFSGAGGVGQSSGLQGFIKYAKDNLPGVKKLFGDIVGTVGHAISVLAPLGPALVTTLDVAVTWLDKTFLPALQKLLPALLVWVGFVIGAFSSIVKFILYDFIGPTINGLAKAFGWLPTIGPQLKTAATNFNTFADTVTGNLDKAATGVGNLAAQLDLLNNPINVPINIHVSEHGGNLDLLSGISLRGAATSKKLTKRGAGGGYVDGPGTSTSDSVPLLASTGEYVMQASQVQRLGPAYFDHLNAGGTPKAGGDVFNISGPGVQEVAHAVTLEKRKTDLLYPVGV